jgi:hypothetical protein
VLLVLGGLPIDTGSAPASSNMLTAAVSSVFLRANARGWSYRMQMINSLKLPPSRNSAAVSLKDVWNSQCRATLVALVPAATDILGRTRSCDGKEKRLPRGGRRYITREGTAANVRLFGYVFERNASVGEPVLGEGSCLTTRNRGPELVRMSDTPGKFEVLINF